MCDGLNITRVLYVVDRAGYIGGFGRLWRHPVYSIVARLSLESGSDYEEGGVRTRAGNN